MKILMTVAVACGFSLALLATNETSKATGAAATSDPAKEERKAAIRDGFQRETGGIIIKPDVGNGVYLVANAQKRFPKDKFRRPVGYLRAFGKLSIDLREVDPSAAAAPGPDAAKSLGGTVVLFVKEDKSCPQSIGVFPDERWGFVNVAALDADKPGDDELVLRIRKAILRATCFLLGAGGSQHPNTLVGSFKDGLKDYDRFPAEGLPPDVFPKMASYLKNIGVRPIVRATYLSACEHGWAPAPTNQYQKAIWDKVHAMPTAPMKILPESKRGKK